MADLDTRSKRASSINILLPWAIAPPAPDGTIGQGDRQHVALSYSGILATGAITVKAKYTILVEAIRRGIIVSAIRRGIIVSGASRSVIAT